MDRTRTLSWLTTVLAAVVVALVAVAATPAAADHAPPPGQVSGSGNVEGTESVLEEEFTGAICLRNTRTVFAMRGAGTYQGRTAGGQDVVYAAQVDPGDPLYANGPLHIEAENTETYYHGPSGTHGTADAGCGAATAGSPVPAEFRIFAAGHVYRVEEGTGAQVPCRGQGTFARVAVAAEINWRAEWTLSEDCVVVGNEAGTPGSGIARAGTTTSHHGRHEPCFNPPCLDNIRVDYKQYLPVEGFHVGLSGPQSVVTGDPATVVARVTDDGQPVANATVSFSVTGPGPATPPGGAALTAADGRASFTFTAAVAGNYTVTASAARGTDSDSATLAIQVTPPPPPTVTLVGPTRAQTEDAVTVTATFTDAGDPVPGAEVDFAVVGAGQATPSSGSAVTDANGRASFSFVGDRAGDYTVNATATYLAGSASTSHSVRLDIRDFYRVGSLPLEQGETGLRAAVVDPEGDYAYFAAGLGIVKVDLRTFQRVDFLPGEPAVGSFTSAVIDTSGDFAYFGSSDISGAAKVVKIDLNTFQRVGVLSLAPGEVALYSAVIDAAGRFAYFGVGYTQNTFPGRVVKIDLQTFQRVGAVTFQPDEREILSAVIDPAGVYAYFSAAGEGGTPGRVVKLDLRTFERVGALTLNGVEEQHLYAALIDPHGRYAYFGTRFGSPARVVKVDLTTFQRVDVALMAEGETHLDTAVMDPSGKFAYFGTLLGTGRSDSVVKVNLDTFERVGAIALPVEESTLASAVIDPRGGYAYFGAAPTGFPTPPARVVKFAVSRPPVPWLMAGNDAYGTPYSTPLTVVAPGVLANDVDTEDGDPLTAGQSTKPAYGSVSLGADGSFTYTPDAGFSGTDTFTYQASDAMDYSAPATVTVTVAPPPEGVHAVLGGAFGFATDVSLFQAPSETRGPSPSVTVPANGGQASATDPDGDVGQYGPAFIFENHGPLTVQTSGATGPAGSVTSSAVVEDIEDNYPFIARSPDGEASSTCTATRNGLSGSSRIVNGYLALHTDPNSGEATEEITFPHTWDPAPNTTYEGALDHVGDRWRIVFNEHVLSPDSITVNAVHMYLLGPTAVGDMIIGQSRCALETSDANTAPVAADDAYTAITGEALEVAAAGVLANDTDPESQSLTASTLAPLRPPSSGGGTWTFPGQPAQGSLALGHDGSFTYTPEPGYTGPDSFTYVASDSRGQSDTATVNLTVQHAPVAGDDAYSTAAGTAITVVAPGVLANDTDADGDALTAGSASDPAGGSVVLNADGSFTYTPDAGFSGTDTFTYAAADPYGATDTATVTVTVSPPPPTGDTRPTQLSVSDLSVSEGNSGTTAATFTVTRLGVLSGTSTVKYKTSGGTATAGSDYTAVALNTLSFAPGETTKTVTVAIAGDGLPEANETLNLVLSSPSGAVIADTTGVATVVNDDGAAYLAVNNVTVGEGSPATFTVARSANTTGASSVKYRSATGTAGAEDFSAVGLTEVSFAPGETTKTVTLEVPQDGVDEANETFALALSAPVGAVLADASGTATIVDDEGTVTPGPATFLSLNDVSANEGGPATVTVTRSGNTAGASSVKVRTSAGTATAGSDYTAVALTPLSFAPGETTKTVTVEVAADVLAEKDETFRVVLSAPSGAVIADTFATATIVNDDGAAYLAVDNIAVTEGNAATTTATFTVTRSGNTTGTSTAKYRTSGGSATAGSDYTAVALAGLSFAPGETSKTVTIDITGDTAKEANETVNLVLSTPSAGTVVSDASGTATVTDDD